MHVQIEKWETLEIWQCASGILCPLGCHNLPYVDLLGKCVKKKKKHRYDATYSTLRLKCSGIKKTTTIKQRGWEMTTPAKYEWKRLKSYHFKPQWQHQS